MFRKLEGRPLCSVGRDGTCTDLGCTCTSGLVQSTGIRCYTLWANEWDSPTNGTHDFEPIQLIVSGLYLLTHQCTKGWDSPTNGTLDL